MPNKPTPEDLLIQAANNVPGVTPRYFRIVCEFKWQYDGGEVRWVDTQRNYSNEINFLNGLTTCRLQRKNGHVRNIRMQVIQETILEEIVDE